ncbi:MAG TPA: YiiX family permuted papain-like enzyme [Thermoanaerobaculia bacterium]|jgi:hypothetical protein
MRMLLALLLLAVVPSSSAAGAPLERALRDGDIIFHESQSGQSRAIQAATKSRYSHMGILYRVNGQWQVYEAVQPVKLTPLKRWIARGKGGHFVVKRLRDAAVLTPATLARMRRAGERFRGKPYDLTFEWNDGRIYCSELVWKIYKLGAGVEIGRLQRLREFDLSHPAVKQKMRERYGSKIPLDEPVISPAAMFESNLLREVIRQ